MFYDLTPRVISDSAIQEKLAIWLVAVDFLPDFMLSEICLFIFYFGRKGGGGGGGGALAEYT